MTAPFGWYIKPHDGAGVFSHREPAHRPGVQHVTALYSRGPDMTEQDLRTAEQAVEDYKMFRDASDAKLRVVFEKRIFHMEKLVERIRENLGRVHAQR